MKPDEMVGYAKPRTPLVIPERVCDRAISRYALDEATGCHISTYSTASHGYAQVGWKETSSMRGTTAHRAAWTAANGPIPEGMTVDHMCKQRRCVNVEHLRLLSNYENARRTHDRDWKMGHCINGHPNSLLREFSNGAKPPRVKCGQCHKDVQRRYQAKRAARLEQ